MSDLSSFVYPITETIRLEIDNIQDMTEYESHYGVPVKIGRSEWCLVIMKLNNSLCCYLKCQQQFSRNECIKLSGEFRLFKKLTPGEKQTRNFEKIMNNSSDTTWIGESTELIDDGHVTTDKIVVECLVNISEEKLLTNSYNFNLSRPNENDLKKMFPNSLEKAEKKIIKKEVSLAEISESESFSHTVYIDGFPCKFGFRKENKDGEDILIPSLYCNFDDKSEWWRIEASAVFQIKNTKNNSGIEWELLSNALFSNQTFSSCGKFSLYWSQLINPENGFVNNGRIILTAMVYMQKKYGFDEKTERGIDKPMWKMTDAVIIVDEERFHVSRMMLSHQSSWFCNLFSADPEKTEFILSDVTRYQFLMFLKLVYNGPIELKDEKKMQKFLKILEKYDARECIRRLDQKMAHVEFTDDMKILKLIDKYQLPNLKSRYIKKLQNITEIKKIFRHHHVIKLSDKLREELTVDDVTESEENDNEPFYTYSKMMEKSEKIGDPKEKFQKFLSENDEAKKLLEDPDVQNVGNSVLTYLATNIPNSGLCQVSFKEFSDPSDMVTFNFKENKMFYSSKQILANASTYFMKRYFGPDAKDDDNTIILDEITCEHFNVLLHHIYHPTRKITDRNLDILLPIAHKYAVTDVLDKCEKYLINTETLEADKKEEYAKKYDFVYLMNACQNYKKNNSRS